MVLAKRNYTSSKHRSRCVYVQYVTSEKQEFANANFFFVDKHNYLKYDSNKWQ